MTKKKANDPLASVDPILADAFSAKEPTIAGFEPETASKKNASGKAGKKVAESEIEFPDLTPTAPGAAFESTLFNNIPVNVSVELGRSEISLSDIYELAEGSIIELERLVGEPLDLVVNGQTIAHGEVVAIDNHYGLRVTNVIRG